MTNKTYSPSHLVAEKYKVSTMWLWRREHDDSGFPKPIRIAGRKFYCNEDLAAFDAAKAAEAAEVMPPESA